MNNTFRDLSEMDMYSARSPRTLCHTRALKSANRLECLMTEFYAHWCLETIGANAPWGVIKRLATRRNNQLDDAKVISWNAGALWRELNCPKKNRYEHYLSENAWFGTQCLRWLQKNKPRVSKHTVIFSYSGTAIEVFKWAKFQGARTVLGMIDPGRVEQEIVREEAARWPGWEKERDVAPELYNQRRIEECRIADVIVVNSRWSLECLEKQGVPPKKIFVIPLCYESAREEADFRRHYKGSLWDQGVRPFTVLFLGQVILRKGIQYLIQAAKHPDLAEVVFDVVGPVGITEAAIRSAPCNMRFHGIASRTDVSEWYRRADLFVLPTISDGFAITQIEAMAHGLPVIATPNCGEVVRDGEDGLIVPVRDSNALVEAILRFVKDPSFHNKCREQAMIRSRDFTLHVLQNKLIELEKMLEI
ncbi:glycosyltransferase family 4 protein [Fontisphaera persica]|uniref:glycosyltransferase family 4 protein n=1 Tax=Fontisphaera persica TaxID=2974023 RepID=UPI0024C0C064|nr:glycosyltransferase family 4 protein [Fontisphaera persica]WCJ59709.1 glycosyltransferase family 4 protein [Fontisphaera persica]